MAPVTRQNPTPDPAVAECLLDVIDPEVGLSVVDLGLVYHASRDAGGINVALTLTTRACPLGEMILEEARERLVARFPEAFQVTVALVWDPPWNPDLITDRGRKLLRCQPKDAA